MERGIRKGDSLSPYILIKLAKVLWRNILKLVVDGDLKGFKATSTFSPILQQFVDDTTDSPKNHCAKDFHALVIFLIIQN